MIWTNCFLNFLLVFLKIIVQNFREFETDDGFLKVQLILMIIAILGKQSGKVLDGRVIKTFSWRRTYKGKQHVHLDFEIENCQDNNRD